MTQLVLQHFEIFDLLYSRAQESVARALENWYFPMTRTSQPREICVNIEVVILHFIVEVYVTEHMNSIFNICMTELEVEGFDILEIYP